LTSYLSGPLNVDNLEVKLLFPEWSGRRLFREPG